MPILIRFVCFAAVLCIPAAALALGIEFSAGAWYQDPSGIVSYDKTTDADDLDLEDDLKYDEKWQPAGRLKIDMPSLVPNVYLMYTPMKWDETGSKNVNFSFGDENFDADIPFESKLRMNHLDAALYYGLPFLTAASAGVLNLDLGLNLRLLDLKVEIDQRDTGVKASESYLLPVPMVYAGLQITPLDWLAVEAEGRGIGYAGNHYMSLLGRLKIQPFGPLFIAGGYRYDDVRIDYKDVDVDAEFRGPFAEAGFSF
jgi:outer membrane protein